MVVKTPPPSAASPRWTAAELWRMPDNDYKHEIINGRLIVMAPASFIHGEYCIDLSSCLALFVKKHNLGRVLEGQTGYELANGDVLAPDISFVRKERVTQAKNSSQTFFPGSPDLAIEVLSPNDRRRDIEEKVELYLADQTAEVWLVDPTSQTVEVIPRGQPRRILKKGETLEGVKLLPGFKLLLGELFNET
jgi:Uma2 family endonuclease